MSAKEVRLSCAGCGAAFSRLAAEARHRAKLGQSAFYCSRKCFRRRSRFLEAKGYRWERAELDYLRGNWRRLSHKEMGFALGRTENAVSAQLSKMGLIGRRSRKWTAKEVKFLRENRGDLSLKEMAARLGRAPSTVSSMMSYYGLTSPATPLPEAAARRMRELHGRGWLDSEIAASLGVRAHRVTCWRRKNGLPNNRKSAHALARLHARNRAVWEDHYGASSWAECQSLRLRVAAASAGWPQADTPKQARVLEALSAGPLTKARLRELLGFGAVRILDRLVAKGLAGDRGPAHDPRPKRGRTRLYGLAEGVSRHDDRANNLAALAALIANREAS